MENVVYEYKIDSENYILSWQQWPERKRPELINNPEPLPQMNDSIQDENGRLWNQETNKNFRLINDEIKIIQHEKSDDEKFDKKYSSKESYRRLLKGISDPLDSDFLEFKNDLEKTIRKI